MTAQPVSIVLSVPEYAFAMTVAIQRDACKPNRSSRLSRRTTGFGVHLIGAIGEVAARKAFGGKLDLQLRPAGDNHEPDLVLPDGREVEVKTATYSGPNIEMKFEREELGRSKHYCLVHVQQPDTCLVYPVISWEQVQAGLVERDYGYGPRWVYSLNGETT